MKKIHESRAVTVLTAANEAASLFARLCVSHSDSRTERSPRR